MKKNENKNTGLKPKKNNKVLILGISVTLFLLISLYFTIIIIPQQYDENEILLPHLDANVDIKLKHLDTENQLIIVHKGGKSLNLTWYKIIINDMTTGDQITIYRLSGVLEKGQTLILTNISNKSEATFIPQFDEIDFTVGNEYEIEIFRLKGERQLRVDVICEAGDERITSNPSFTNRIDRRTSNPAIPIFYTIL